MVEKLDIEVKLLPGHRGEVNTCCISPNSDIVVTGGDDGKLYIWKAETCLLLCSLSGHCGPVNCCAFSTCGKQLASGSYDSTGRIWDIGVSKSLFVLKGHSKSVEGICYSFDSSLISTVSWDKSVILWNSESGLKIKEFLGHTDCVSSCAFSHTGITLATGGWDNMVILWNIKKKSRLQKHRPGPDPEYAVLEGHSGKVSCVCFSRLGILASASWDRSVKLWNVQRKQLIITFNGHTGWVKALAFTLDSVNLASTADDGSIRVWNLPKLECVKQLKGETDIAVMCKFLSDGRLVISGMAKESQIKSQEVENNDGEMKHRNVKEMSLQVSFA
ncbi:uncharacterized protein LOC120347769 [Styela clava]